MGANSDFVDHNARLEIDKFDDYCDHLLLIDNNKREKNMGVVGVYRLLPDHSFHHLRIFTLMKSMILKN